MGLAKGLAVNTHLKRYPQIPVVFPEAMMFLPSPQISRNISMVCPVTGLWPWAEVVFFISPEGWSKKRIKIINTDMCSCSVTSLCLLLSPCGFIYLVKEPPHVFNVN